MKYTRHLADALDKLLNIKFFQLHYYDFAEKGSMVNKISRDIVHKLIASSLTGIRIPKYIIIDPTYKWSASIYI